MTYEVRAAHADDANDISRIILWALRQTNAKDYSQGVIERVEQSFSPTAVLELLERRKIFVITLKERIVGTAGLDGGVIRTVFVAPDVQGQGVGRLLMAKIEQTARNAGVRVLAVPSSITAEHFYTKLGFKAVRESYHGEERTIIMERSLTAP